LPPDPLPGEQQQPRLERAPGRVVLELTNVFADGNDRFLHRVLRLGVRQPRFERDAIN
jgi:hypothetical protein